jgi:hypothetical protein
VVIEEKRSKSLISSPHPPPKKIFIVKRTFQKCIAMCMDRYMDSFNVVSRAYTDRLRRESHM